MGEHENSTGATDEWYTPEEIFAGLGLHFDLDPCAPAAEGDWPASRYCRRQIRQPEDGLEAEWDGMVWLNPPFGGRHGHIPWLERFVDHGNGVAVVRAYTSAGWWHDWIPHVDAVLFPRGKTKFLRPDGTPGGSPGHGIALLAMGRLPLEAFRASTLGLVWELEWSQVATARRTRHSGNYGILRMASGSPETLADVRGPDGQPLSLMTRDEFEQAAARQKEQSPCK